MQQLRRVEQRGRSVLCKITARKRMRASTAKLGYAYSFGRRTWGRLGLLDHGVVGQTVHECGRLLRVTTYSDAHTARALYHRGEEVEEGNLDE